MTCDPFELASTRQVKGVDERDRAAATGCAAARDGPAGWNRPGCLKNKRRGAQADEAAREDAQTEHGQAVDAERQTEVGGCRGRLQFAFRLVEVHQLDHAQVVEAAEDRKST